MKDIFIKIRATSEEREKIKELGARIKLNVSETIRTAINLLEEYIKIKEIEKQPAQKEIDDLEKRPYAYNSETHDSEEREIVKANLKYKTIYRKITDLKQGQLNRFYKDNDKNIAQIEKPASKVIKCNVWSKEIKAEIEQFTAMRTTEEIAQGNLRAEQHTKMHPNSKTIYINVYIYCDKNTIELMKSPANTNKNELRLKITECNDLAIKNDSYETPQYFFIITTEKYYTKKEYEIIKIIKDNQLSYTDKLTQTEELANSESESETIQSLYNLISIELGKYYRGHLSKAIEECKKQPALIKPICEVFLTKAQAKVVKDKVENKQTHAHGHA